MTQSKITWGNCKDPVEPTGTEHGTHGAHNFYLDFFVRRGNKGTRDISGVRVKYQHGLEMRQALYSIEYAVAVTNENRLFVIQQAKDFCESILP